MIIARILRFFISLASLFILLWVMGLIIFVGYVSLLAEPEITAKLTPTDAVVVLTGGSERVSTGIELLKAHTAQKLYISGVYQTTSVEQIPGIEILDKGQRSCCVVLGHIAGTTRGNAEETRAWVKQDNIHSLRLVTANYHMPRSMLMFQKAMPGITIIPHPVAPDDVKLQDWWQRPGTTRLLVTEYSKYLLAFLRAGLGR